MGPPLERDPDRILAGLESWGARLELGRVERLLEHFGRPQEAYATVVIAGTNGKGSTASLLSAMATSAGYRTGLFTSPHLESLEERLRVDGRSIGRPELAELLTRILEEAETAGLEPPTYFEAMTLAGYLWFERAEVDLAVFEVGMGGRLDATNTSTPCLTVVTEIGLDHTNQLGDTLAAIAVEKAGIFRPGVIAVSGATEDEARESLRRQAESVGAPFVEAESRVRRVSMGDFGEADSKFREVHLETSRAGYRLQLGLAGKHQARNLQLAVVAAEILAEQGWSGLDRHAIEKGVRRALWPGRLEEVVLPGGKVVWLDAAHNPQGARALAEFLARRLEAYDLLFGILSDKDARPVLESVAAGAERVVLTEPPSQRRLDPAELASWLPGRRPVIEPDRGAALEQLLEGESALVVCGSLYLVGWVRESLRRRFGVPRAAAESLLSD